MKDLQGHAILNKNWDENSPIDLRQASHSEDLKVDNLFGMQNAFAIPAAAGPFFVFRGNLRSAQNAFGHTYPSAKGVIL